MAEYKHFVSSLAQSQDLGVDNLSLVLLHGVSLYQQVKVEG